MNWKVDLVDVLGGKADDGADMAEVVDGVTFTPEAKSILTMGRLRQVRELQQLHERTRYVVSTANKSSFTGKRSSRWKVGAAWDTGR